jgi:hypothetical protein
LIILVLIGYLVLKKTDNVHYKIPKIDPVKKADIDRIEIKKANKTIILAKKDSQWVLEPKGFSTDTEKVTQISDTICQLTLTDLASKSKNYALYELDQEKGIQVKAFQKGKVIREFEVGKAAPTYGHTFVKLKDDDNIYYARDSFREQFDAKMDDFRDRLIMKVASDEVKEVTVETDGKTYVFIKKSLGEPPAKPKDEKTGLPPKPNIMWVSPDGEKTDRAAVDSLVEQVNDFFCMGFIEDKTKDDFKTQVPVYTLKLKGNKDYVVSFFQKAAKTGPTEEEKYPAICSESPYPFYMSSWKAEQTMKKPGDLFEKEVKNEVKEAKEVKKK